MTGAVPRWTVSAAPLQLRQIVFDMCANVWRASRSGNGRNRLLEVRRGCLSWSHNMGYDTMLSDRKTWAGALWSRCPHKALNLTILLILSPDPDRAYGFLDARALRSQTFILLFAEDCQVHHTTSSNRPAPTRMKVILSIFIAAAAFDPVRSQLDIGVCGERTICFGIDSYFVYKYSSDCVAASSDGGEHAVCCAESCRLTGCHANGACPPEEDPAYVRKVEKYCQKTSNPGKDYTDCASNCCSASAYDECPNP